MSANDEDQSLDGLERNEIRIHGGLVGRARVRFRASIRDLFCSPGAGNDGRLLSRTTMATEFADFMAELKREAKAEGPEAVAELKYFRERFRLARRRSRRPGHVGASQRSQ